MQDMEDFPSVLGNKMNFVINIIQSALPFLHGGKFRFDTGD